jgi:serine/threonine protein kinase
MHALRFLHRDIKLENVLLADPMDVTTAVLADFGEGSSGA